ncbi:MAG: TRAP transporter large permease subunit [Treponema sp.]|jgi:tripartite ATP-independent transporter DctM subunit|nr:TRAP transporter large permease subunit [Treponema sp.]
MALLPVTESIARILFKTGIPASTGFIPQLLLFSGLLAGMICTRNDGHLSITIVQYTGESLRQKLKIVSSLVSVFVAVVIAWSSVSFIKIGLETKMIGFIPVRVFAAIIPVSFCIIAVRFAHAANLGGWKMIFPALSFVLGTAASFPLIAKIIWGFDMPDAVFDICDKFYLLAWYSKIPFVIFLIMAALGGTPLFVVMGGLALLLLQASGGEMDSVAADIYAALTNTNIIAIPLFTVAGFILSESRAGARLVNTFRCFFSWLPGGIIFASVIICAFFTSFTGASGVTILALGGILYAVLSEHFEYPQKFSIGLLTSVGSIGLLFPPSLPLILVGTISQTNIVHLFLGGIIPGVILVAAMIIFGIAASLKIKIPPEKFDGRKALYSLKGSSLEILLPVFLIAGYFTGFFSLVEIGAVAVLYIFIVEVFIYKDIKLSDIKNVFNKAIPIIGGVLSILALSKAVSYYIVDTQAPANIASWLQNAFSSKYIFLLLLNLALIVVGCLMDIFSAILIVLPLIVPMGQAYGIDPVHLGIIFLVNLEAGFITPPVGLNLFLASYRFQKPFVDICRHVFPFLLVRLVIVLLVTYLPWLTTFLVNLFR